MKILYLLLLLTISVSAQAQCTSPCVNAASAGYTVSTSVSTTAANFTGAHLGIIIATWYTADSIASVSGTGCTGSWTKLTTATDTGIGLTAIYYCTSFTGTASDVGTINCTGNCFPTISYAGFTGTYTYDGVQNTGSSGTPSVNTGTVTPTGDGRLVISGASFDGGGSPTPNIAGVSGSYTLATSNSGGSGRWTNGIAYWLQLTAASTSTTFTGSAGVAAGVIASFSVSVPTFSAKRKVLN